MKVINIGGKDYAFEFTIEASLYNECTEKIGGLMTRLNEAESKDDIYSLICGIADIPGTALTMFYAGLLEHHGVDGDGSVPDKKTAKALIKKYFDENKDGENGNFYGLMALMIETMADDGFFKLIGLDQVMEQPKKEPKKPQDHKKKATKATEK